MRTTCTIGTQCTLSARPASKAPWPLLVFAALTVPLASWQLWLFPGIPNYYAQHFFIYPAFLFMCWAWLCGLWSVGEAWTLARPFVPWLGLLLLFQGVAGLQSAYLYAPENTSKAMLMAGALGKLCVQLPFLLFFALLCRVLLRSQPARGLLLRGALWTLVALSLWCAVQIFYVYSTPNSGWYYLAEQADASTRMGTLRGAAGALLAAVAPLLEARWPDAIYDFYHRGAYSLTLARCNGFFEEASALASMLGVFFTPLAFGVLALGSARGKIRLVLMGYVLLVCSVAMLLLSRTITGQVVAAAVLVLLILAGLRGNFKKIKLPLAVLLLAASCYVAMTAPHVPSYLLTRMRYFDMAAAPRVISTLDTVDIITAHPWVGVGRGWYFAHLHQGVRWQANVEKDPELRAWTKRGSGGELSALPALAAQYGLPLTMAALFFVLNILRKLYALRRELPESALLQFCAPACAAWAVLSFTTLLASVDVRNTLFCLPLFIFYAVSQRVGLEEK